MADTASQCERRDHETDRPGEDGDASDDSFVIVNGGDSDDAVEGGLETTSDPRVSGANAGPVVRGDQERGGGEGGVSLESRDDDAEGVVIIDSSGIELQTKPDVVEGKLEHQQEEPASGVEAGGKLDSDTNQHEEFEPAVVVEGNQDPEAKSFEGSESAPELESAAVIIGVELLAEPVVGLEKEDGKEESSVTNPRIGESCEEEVEPAFVVIEGKPDSKTNRQEEPQSELAVEEKQLPEAAVEETSRQADLETTLEVEEVQKSEAAVMETDRQMEPELSADSESTVEMGEHRVSMEVAKIDVQGESETIEAETSQQLDLESALEVEKVQKSEAADLETDRQIEAEPSLDPEPPVKVEEHQASMEGSEVDAQDELAAVEVGEKQKAAVEIMVKEANEQAEPESTELEEKHQAYTAIGTHDHEEPDSSVHVEEKPGIEISFTGTGSNEELKSVVEVEAEQQPKVSDREIDGHQELKPVALQPETVVRARELTEAEGNREPETVTVEPSDQPGLVSDLNPETTLEIEDENGSSETAEAISISHVEGIRSEADVAGYSESEQHETVASSTKEFEMEDNRETVASSTKEFEMEDNREPETVVDEPSNQLTMVSELKPRTSLEIDDENGFSNTAEASSTCHVDGMQSAADSTESGENQPTNCIDVHLGTDATISPSLSPNSTILHCVDKEIADVAPVIRGDDMTNDATHEGDVCQTIPDSMKDIAVDNNDEVKLEHIGNDSECTGISVHGDQNMHKDDGEKSNGEEVDPSGIVQTPPDVPAGPALNGEGLGAHAMKRKFCYIIRIPRFNDDDLRTKLQHARLQLDEETQSRDSVRVEIQKKKATLNGYREKLESAKAEERAARAAVSAKRQEMDSVQSMINKMKSASSIDDINDKIHRLEHTLQHESITLPLEKQYIREIKQLRQQREQISANMGPQAEIQEAFDRRDQIEEQFKTLKKELDSLRTNVLRAESDVKAARKKCDDEYQLLKDLQEQYRVADDHRQVAYAHMDNFRHESSEKIKYFNMYRDDQRAAINYISVGDKAGLQSHCSKQVEKVMELWNNNDEFRKQYIKYNVISTLRRLKTIDGRSLGPDEEPPILHYNYNRSSSKISPPLPNDRMHFPVLDLEVTVESSAAKTVPEQVTQTIQSAKSKKPPHSKETVHANIEEVQMVEEEITRRKEEEELVRKAEELARKEDEQRKERAAAKLKEQHRMEQKAKAKEAEERKKRMAEKAKAKAEYRAQKEVELREKRRAKKEKKTAVSTEAPNEAGAGNAPIVDTTKEPETETVIRSVAGKSSRLPAPVKQYNKIQPLPLPLRNRGKKKIQTWMWVLLATLLVFLLFLAGNYASLSHLNLPNFGF